MPTHRPDHPVDPAVATGFLAQLEILRRRFVERTLADAAQLRSLRASCLSPARTPEIEHALGRLTHSLSGSAGIFGYAGISETAFRIELMLRRSELDEAELAEAIDGLIGELDALAATED